MLTLASMGALADSGVPMRIAADETQPEPLPYDSRGTISGNTASSWTLDQEAGQNTQYTLAHNIVPMPTPTCIAAVDLVGVGPWTLDDATAAHQALVIDRTGRMMIRNYANCGELHP